MYVSIDICTSSNKILFFQTLSPLFIKYRQEFLTFIVKKTRKRSGQKRLTPRNKKEFPKIVL
ncbi:hypothetical protein EY674_04290 [Enterococcus faecalis]|nr:hypothetical protein [Enterococcus faecalis]MBO6381820.1 hypothetical protein [Enterococcus faecalis]